MGRPGGIRTSKPQTCAVWDSTIGLRSIAHKSVSPVLLHGATARWRSRKKTGESDASHFGGCLARRQPYPRGQGNQQACMWWPSRLSNWPICRSVRFRQLGRKPLPNRCDGSWAVRTMLLMIEFVVEFIALNRAVFQKVPAAKNFVDFLCRKPLPGNGHKSVAAKFRLSSPRKNIPPVSCRPYWAGRSRVLSAMALCVSPNFVFIRWAFGSAMPNSAAS